LVQKLENAPKSVPANVRLITGHLPDDELRQLQNECGVHLCPSRSEGWGHHLHEGMSCGALVVTTDAPPMNEFITAESGSLVPVSYSEPRHLGTNFFFDPAAFDLAIAQLLGKTDNDKKNRGIAARAAFLETCKLFEDSVKVAIEDLVTK
jgi:glycosyltransferase involved in cell wall biosynthesis